MSSKRSDFGSSPDGECGGDKKRKKPIHQAKLETFFVKPGAGKRNKII